MTHPFLTRGVSLFICIAMNQSLAAAETALTPPTDVSIAAHPEGASTDEDELIRRGIQLRRERSDGKALEKFREAFSIHGSPRAQAQMALAEQALGNWVDAERELLGALRNPDTWIERNRVALETSLAAIRQHLGLLHITCGTPVASLFINSQPTEFLPSREFSVPAGPVSIEIVAPGYIVDKRSLVVEPQQLVEVTCELVLLGNEVSSLPKQKVHDPQNAARMVVEPPAPVAKSGDTPRMLTWVLAASAGVLLSEALIAQLARERYVAKYNDDSACVYGELSREERCGRYRDQANLAEAFAIVGYVAGGAAAFGSALLFITPRSHAATGAATNSIGLGYGGSF